MASLDSHALYIGHWIWSQTWWTLADRSMVVSDTDGVHSAGIFVASVVASVGQSVTKLRRRAVDVVDAGNGSTSFDHVVGVTSVESRWTFTVSHVVVDHAESVGSTGDKVADRLAGQQTLIRAPAGLILGTLAVR